MDNELKEAISGLSIGISLMLFGVIFSYKKDKWEKKIRDRFEGEDE